MRKYLLITITNIILIFLQESFLAELFGSTLNPNLVIALSFALLLTNNEDAAYFSALLGGLLLDFLGTGIVGLSPLIFVLLILIAKQVQKTITSGAPTQIIFIILTTVVYKVFRTYPPFLINFPIIFAGVINSAIAVFFAQILKRFKARYLSSEYRIRA